MVRGSNKRISDFFLIVICLFIRMQKTQTGLLRFNCIANPLNPQNSHTALYFVEGLFGVANSSNYFQFGGVLHSEFVTFWYGKVTIKPETCNDFESASTCYERAAQNRTKSTFRWFIIGGSENDENNF